MAKTDTDDLSKELERFITGLVTDTKRLSRANERDWQSAAALEPAEAQHIRRAVSACNGNKSQAARLLQIHCRSLQRKLARLSSGKKAKKRR